MPLRLALGLLAALTLAAPVARAADPAAQARELFQRGEAALADGRSKEAIEDFEAAYKAGNSPSLLFYMAEAHQQAGNDAKALAEYQLYLEKVPNGPKRAEAEEHIAALKPGKAAATRKVAVDEISLAPVPPPAKKKVELDEMDLAENKKAPPAAANANAAANAAAAESKRERRRRKKAEADAAATAEASKAAASVPPAPATAVIVKAPEAPPTVAMVVTPSMPPASVVHESPPPVPVVPPAPVAVAVIAPAPTPAPAPAPVVAAAPAPVEHPAMIAAPPPLAPIVVETEKPLVVPNVPLRSHDVAPYRPPAPPPQVAIASPAVPVMIETPPPVPENGTAMRNAGLIIGTVGIAALATGGLFGVGAMGAASDLNTDAAAGLRFDPDTQSRGQRDQKLEIAFVAGGAACLITGAILFIVSPSSSGDSVSSDRAPSGGVSLGYAALVPVSGGAAASASLRF